MQTVVQVLEEQLSEEVHTDVQVLEEQFSEEVHTDVQVLEELLSEEVHTDVQVLEEQLSEEVHTDVQTSEEQIFEKVQTKPMNLESNNTSYVNVTYSSNYIIVTRTYRFVTSPPARMIYNDGVYRGYIARFYISHENGLYVAGYSGPAYRIN